jgi:DNA polymerase-3 subunit delta'
VEGDRKVIIVFDAERLNDTAANKLLKTLEEPPPGAFLVLVTAGADQLLPTIRSRCQRIDFAFVGAAAVTAALVSSGVEPERARLLAGLAGGRLDRAHGLDGRMAGVRRAFVDAAAGLDGTGASVAVQADAIHAALQEAVGELEVAQQAEAVELEASLEAAGYPDRVARAQRREVEERHRREHRRARVDALVEGITALETVYRDALAAPGASPLNGDRPVLAVDPRACVRALEACRRARQGLAEFNPNEGLLVERLLLQLPAVANGAAR